MTSLAQAGDRLEPAEDLFHSFAAPLAEQVARMASVLRRSIALLTFCATCGVTRCSRNARTDSF